MKCTWKNCENEGIENQIGKDGKVWACLCKKHKEEFDTAFKENNTKGILRVWVLANGGADKLSKRVAEEIDPNYVLQ